jgi:hypothetical protein
MHFPSRRPFLAVALTTAVALAAIGAAVAAATTSTPAGGTFHVFGVSSGQGGGGKVLITGAIGDHGKSQSVTKTGKPSSNGSYVKLAMTQGNIMLNQSKLKAAVNHAFNNVVVNPSTCSTAVSASGTLPIVSGTGLYATASGSAHITVSVGFIFPRLTSGKCNESNSATPTASQQIVYGTGTVSFP